MNGQFGKKSNPYVRVPGSGDFGKKSKLPNGTLVQPKEEIEETIPDSDEGATVEEIESIEEAMNEMTEETPKEPEKDTD